MSLGQSIVNVDPMTTTVTLLGGPSSAAGASTSGQAGNVIKEDGGGDEERFSFGSLHAALGQSFVQDRLKRRQEQEVLKDVDKTPEEKRDESEKECIDKEKDDGIELVVV